MALSFIVALDAQGTWTWNQLCSNNEWNAYCTGSICGTNPDRYWHYNNWGQSYCGSASGLGFPGPGSTVIFPATANALLASNVDIKTVTLNSGGQLTFAGGSLTLRDPANNNAPGVFTNAGLFRLPSTGSLRYWSGAIVNTGTLRHEANLVRWTGASLQNSGTVELLTGDWQVSSGTNSLTNTGVVRKRAVDTNTPGQFTLETSIPIDNRGTVSVEQGVLTIYSGISGTNAVWDVSAGATLNWFGNVTLSGSHRGTIAGELVLRNYRTITAPTTLNFSGNGLAFTEGTINADSAGLTNAGVFRLPSTGSLRYWSGTIVNTGTLRHEANLVRWTGASLQNSGTVELHSGAWEVSSGTNSVQNLGTGSVIKTGTGTFTLGISLENRNLVSVQQGELVVAPSFENRATVSVQQGALTVLGAITGGGIWNVSAGTTLNWGGTGELSGSHNGTVAGSATLSGSHTVPASGATLNFSGNGLAFIEGTINAGSAGLTNAGVFRLPSTGSLRYWSGTIVNTGTLRHEANLVRWTGASLQNSGTVELLTGDWQVSSGTNSLTNTGVVRKRAVDTNTPGQFTLETSIPIDNRGTVSVEQGVLTIYSGISGTNAVWDVSAGATLNWFGNVTLSGSHRGTIAGELVLRNYRTITAPTTLNFSGNGLAFMEGTINADSAGLTNAGVFRLPSTGSLRYWSGAIVNTGTLRHEANLVRWTGASLQNSGTVELHSGAWEVSSGTNSLTNTGVVRKHGGDTEFVLNDGIALDNRNTLTVEQGTLRVRTSINGVNAVWDVAAGATLIWENNRALSGSHRGTITGTFQLYNTRTITAPTTLNFSGNGLAFIEGTINAGSAGLTNAGVFRLPSTGSLRYWSGTIVNTGTLRHEANLVRWTGASLQNSGTVELHSGEWQVSSGTNTIQNTTTGKLLKLTSGDFVIAHPVQNAGLLDHREGGLSIHQLVQSRGETRIHRNRTLNLSTPMELQGGKLTGAGTLNATINHTGGTIAPGIDDPNHPSLNPLGILTLNGNLTMGTNAALEIELSGTSNADPANPQYDQLIISGSNRSVQINGTLRLKGRNGYVPNVGDTYDIVVRTGSWNPTGAFTTVVVDPATLPCVQVQVRYLTDRVQVEVTHAGERPDTNGDGCVDDADLLNVLFNFGLTGENPADVNCDLIVDDADLLAVLFAFGQGC